MCQYDLNTEKILFFFSPRAQREGVRSTVEYLTSASQIMSAGSALMDFDKVAKGEHLQYGAKFMQIRLWPKLARKFVRLGAFHFRSGSLPTK